MLDPLAVVFLEIGHDLPLLVAILVDRDTDAAAGRCQRARGKAGKLAFNVKKPDLAKIEQIAVELEPDVHVPLKDIMRQVIEIVETDASGFGLRDPVVFLVIGRRVVILIHKVD